MTTIKWSRSSTIPGRLRTTNGADILSSDRIVVAVDRPDSNYPKSWTIRVWVGKDPQCSEPYEEDTQRDAKGIAVRFLALAADRAEKYGHPINRGDVLRLLGQASAAYYTELNERDRAEMGF